MSITENTKNLIEFACRLRLKRGLTLKEVGEMALIDQGNLSRIENLKQGVTLDNFCRLIGAYGYEVVLQPKEEKKC